MSLKDGRARSAHPSGLGEHGVKCELCGPRGGWLATDVRTEVLASGTFQKASPSFIAL